MAQTNPNRVKVPAVCALLSMGLAAPAFADRLADLQQCQNDARTLMKNLEARGGSYVRTFKNFERDCVNGASEFDRLSGYEEVRAAYAHLKPIADRADQERAQYVAVDEVRFWVGRNVGPGSDYLRIPRDKQSAEYKAVLATLAECKAKLDELFAKFPAARQAPYHEKAGDLSMGDAYDFCNGGALRKAASAEAEWDKGQVELGLKSIFEWENKYRTALKSYEESQKLIGKKYGAMAAVSDFELIMPVFSSFGAAVDYAMEHSPNTKSQVITFAGKQWVVGELSKYAWATFKKMQAATQALEGKAEAEERQWNAELQRRLQGDRKATFARHGMPVGFDGGDYADPAKRLDMLVSKGTFWLYGDGSCEIRYDFRGSSKVSRKVTPRGCE